jgi:hypothetical protein
LLRCSKLEPSLARALGERLDATVVHVAAAIEHALLDPGRLRLAGERLADRRLLGLRSGRAARASSPASVRPASSSTSWAKMPRFERKTTSLGRSAVPEILPRTRR